jgi:hypothetical protein
MPHPARIAIVLTTLLVSHTAPALAAVRTDAQAVALVRTKLTRTPETKARLSALKKAPFLLYVESRPGQGDRFYRLYAGTDEGDHTARLWTLLVDPKTDEVLGYDLLEDKPLTWKAFVAKVRHNEL